MANIEDEQFDLIRSERRGSISDIFRRSDFKENLGATPPKSGAVWNRRLTRAANRRVAFETATAAAAVSHNAADEDGDAMDNDGYASDKATATPGRALSTRNRRTQRGTRSKPCMKVPVNRALLEAKKILDEGRKRSLENTKKTNANVVSRPKSHVEPWNGSGVGRPSPKLIMSKDDDDLSIATSPPSQMRGRSQSSRNCSQRISSARGSNRTRSNSNDDLYKLIHRQALQTSSIGPTTKPSFVSDAKTLIIPSQRAGMKSHASARQHSRPIALRPDRNTRSPRSRPYLAYASFFVVLLSLGAAWVFPELTTLIRAAPASPIVLTDNSQLLVQCKHWKSLVTGWSELDVCPVRLMENWYRVRDVASGLGIDGDVEALAAFVATCGGLRVSQDATDGWLVRLQ